MAKKTTKTAKSPSTKMEKKMMKDSEMKKMMSRMKKTKMGY